MSHEKRGGSTDPTVDPPLGRRGSWRRIISRLDRVIEVIGRFALLVGSVLIFVVMFWILAEILRRPLDLEFVQGTIEVVSYSLLVMTLLFLPTAIRRGKQIRSTVVIDRVPVRARRWFAVFANLVGAATLFVIAYAAIEPAMRSIENLERLGSGVVRLVAYPAWLVVLTMSALAALEYLLRMIRVAQAEDDDPPSERDSLTGVPV